MAARLLTLPSTAARVIYPAALAAALGAVGSCTKNDAAADRPRTAAHLLAVSRAERADATVVGPDTLSDSAHVTGVYPEADGDAVAFTFADPARRIGSGLAIAQQKRPTPALLWPDSVTAVWWSAPHAIGFTTASGTGVHVIVDVHAERATVATEAAQRAPAAPRAPDRSDPLWARASSYVDSVRMQPAGRPERSALRYSVAAMRPSPDRRFVAFYVAATDSTGRRMNPAWYAMETQGAGVAPVDEVVGPVSEMPEGAAGWTGDGRFFYAKRQTLWEAAVGEDAVRQAGHPARDTMATKEIPGS